MDASLCILLQSGYKDKLTVTSSSITSSNVQTIPNIRELSQVGVTYTIIYFTNNQKNKDIIYNQFINTFNSSLKDGLFKTVFSSYCTTANKCSLTEATFPSNPMFQSAVDITPTTAPVSNVGGSSSFGPSDIISKTFYGIPLLVVVIVGIAIVLCGIMGCCGCRYVRTKYTLLRNPRYHVHTNSPHFESMQIYTAYLNE